MRLLSAALSLFLLLAVMTACGTKPVAEPSAAASGDAIEPETPSSSATPSIESSADSVGNSSPDPETSSADETAGSNMLVVYYSASGNTRSAAEDISALTGADIFELIPEEPYTDADLNWREEGSRVNLEHDDPSLQDVALTDTAPPSWDTYDIVFLGYPIWWGEAAWPVRGFVTANEFSGKTVIPFCTSTSSGIGSSAQQLADLAAAGDWAEGHRFASAPSESDVADWISELGV